MEEDLLKDEVKKIFETAAKIEYESIKAIWWMYLEEKRLTDKQRVQRFTGWLEDREMNIGNMNK